MYDSLAVTSLGVSCVVLSRGNKSPQSLSQANEDDTIGVDELPQSAGWEPAGIFVGFRRSLELFLGVCLRIGQHSCRFNHQCRLDTNVSDDRGLTAAFADEPPFRAMPRERSTRQVLGGGTRNRVS